MGAGGVALGAAIGSTVTAAASTNATTLATTSGTCAAGTRIGMSAPISEWDTRLSETGPVGARRLFDTLVSPSKLDLAASELAAGRMPILSYKIPNNDWTGLAAGKYDGALWSLTGSLGGLGGQVFACLHHEPQGDGTPAAYAAMQRHGLPILGTPANVLVGPIANGFWWSSMSQGLTDAEIAAWLPADVLALCDVVAADCYQSGTPTAPGEDGGMKMTNLSAWAGRVGVTRLGAGEYNGFTAAAITNAGNAALDGGFAFANVFNSDRNTSYNLVLTGDRLDAFKATLSDPRTII